jgi:hypothetical protein
MPASTHVTRDPDLRSLLVARLEYEHGGDPGAFICHEFSICRSRARIDVAVVNGSLAGFEIKSGADRLDRLPRQQIQFDRIFDSVTVVCAPRHAERVLQLVPDWYGVWVAEPAARTPLQQVQATDTNPQPSARARATLLWRREMVEVLTEHEVAPHPRATRRTLVDQLIGLLSADQLSISVNEKLKARLQATQTPS